MRLVTFVSGAIEAVGVQDGESARPTGYDSMLGLIADGQAGLERAAAFAAKSDPVSIDRLKAPIPRPGTIFGSGVNFKDHGIPDPAFVVPTEPRIDFIKLASAVIGPGDEIVIPPTDGVIARPEGFQVDYEVELAAVFGRTAKDVSEADALDYIFGYTLVNDVSARRVQLGDKQADLGKNFDTFCPMGPCIVTSDEMPDPQRAHISCSVNGELRQETSLDDQLFPVARLIEWITAIITCQPGDIIMTGTPRGIALFRDPPAWLVAGDEVITREDTIGELRNSVIAR